MTTPPDIGHDRSGDHPVVDVPHGGELRRARRRPSWGLLALALVLAVAGLLALLEGALRTTGTGPTAVLLVDDARCYYAFAPGLQQPREKPGTPLRYVLRTDDRGFRTSGRQEGGATPATTAPRCRVLYVGDSHVQGSWVADADTTPAQLWADLAATGRRVTVANGGVEGHTIAQARMGALGPWRDLARGVVVAQRTANDLTDLIALRRLGCDWQAEPPTRLAPAVRGPVADLAVTSLASDAAARLVSVSRRLQAVEAGQSALGSGPGPLPTLAECTQAADDYLSQSLGLLRGVQAAGGHVLFVGAQLLSCPTRAGEAPFDGRAFVDRWAAGVGAEGAKVLEVHELLRAPGATLQPWDGHPSPAGHAALAAAVAEALVAAGWLDGCR